MNLKGVLFHRVCHDSTVAQNGQTCIYTATAGDGEARDVQLVPSAASLLDAVKCYTLDLYHLLKILFLLPCSCSDEEVYSGTL